MYSIVNAEHFLGSSMRLKNRIRESKPYISIERAQLITQSYKETESEENIIRRAKALDKILSNISIAINEDEIIVGNQADSLFSAPLFPEYSVDWWKTDLPEAQNRTFDRFYMKEGDFEKLAPVIEYWEDRCLKQRISHALTPSIKDAEKTGVCYGLHVTSEGYGHIIVDHDLVIRKGIKDVERRATERLTRIDYLEPADIKKVPFLESIIIVCKAVKKFAMRYSVLASQLAEQEINPARKAQLESIARTCAKVPYEPAENFYEALQSSWFVHLIMQIESSGHSVSLGRFDQFMYPFYENGIQNGILTEEQALELVKHFWVKTNSINKIRSWVDTAVQAGYPMYQNITIGGQKADGSDAVNNLTYLCLNATRDLGMTQPSLAARYFNGSTQKYLAACVETIKKGYGMPAMQNDEGIVPAFLNRGISLEDARNYAMVGCIEPAVPAKFGYRCNGMSHFVMAKVLELTLHDGYDPKSGIQLSHASGKLQDMQSYDEFYNSFIREVQRYNELYIAHDAIADIYTAKYVPDPFTSMLVDDCIERGLPIGDGGAIYDLISGQTSGLANTANSLAAIKKLVFEEKKITAQELMDALADNFESVKSKRIQSMLLHEVPKYGNNDPYVDDIARDVFENHCHMLENYKNARTGLGPKVSGWQVCTSTVTANIPMGAFVGALPDGRKQYSPIAEGVSPTAGTDVNGPTSSMNSVAHLPNVLVSGGQLYNMKFPTEMFNRSEQSADQMISLIRSYFAQKGLHVQFNVIDRNVLLDAKAHPEQYRDLVVRVAGYSAYFVDVSSEVQDDIIRRTEHTF